MKMTPPTYPDVDPLGLKVRAEGSAFDYYPENLINKAVTESTAFINTLDAETKEKAILLYQYAFASGLLPLVFSGRRTFIKQDSLYKKWKSPAYPDAEIAAPPGRSYHNYGRAFDVLIMTTNGEGVFEYGSVALNYINKQHNLGFIWGGDFTTDKDPYHFANGSLSIDELQAESDEYAEWLKNVDSSTQHETVKTNEIISQYEGLWDGKVKTWFQKNVNWILAGAFVLATSLIVLFIIRSQND